MGQASDVLSGTLVSSASTKHMPPPWAASALTTGARGRRCLHQVGYTAPNVTRSFRGERTPAEPLLVTCGVHSRPDHITEVADSNPGRVAQICCKLWLLPEREPQLAPYCADQSFVVGRPAADVLGELGVPPASPFGISFLEAARK